MKKNNILFGFPLLLLAFACHKELSDELSHNIMKDEEGIVLSISCGELLTRGETAPMTAGNQQYNTFRENYVQTIDYFFYPEGGTGANAVIHARESVGAAVDIGQKRTISVQVSDSDVNSLLFPQPSNKCEVYIIANYDGLNVTDLHANGVSTAIDSLKRLVLNSANFKDINPSAQKYHNFVMDGQATVSLIGRTKKVVASGEVELRRIASKIRFKVALAGSTELVIEKYKLKEIDPVTGEEKEYEGKLTETWEPLTDSDMKSYLVNGVNYATVAGTPYSSATGSFDPDKHFSYSAKTYSSTEEGTFYRKTGTDTGETLNVRYYVFDPYYSYPQEWTYGDESEAFIKLQLPWKRRETATFVSYDGTKEATVTRGTAQKSYYYKVILPGGEFARNTWYDNDLYVSILGSELDDASVAIECKYFVVDWNTVPSINSIVRDARYLSVPKDKYVLYNTNDLSFIFDSSHDCKLEIESITMPDFTDGQSLDKTVDLKTRTNPRFNYSFNTKNDNIVGGTRELKLHHELINEIVNTSNKKMDYGPITYEVVIYHGDKTPDDPNYAKKVTIVQYPAIYMSAVTGGSVFVDGYFAHVYKATLPGAKESERDYYYSRSSNNNSYYSGYYGSYDSNGQFCINTPYLNLYDDITGFDLRNIIRLTVTALSSDSNTFTDHTENSVEYIIGDPRQASGWSSSDLEPYLTSISSNTDYFGDTYYTNNTTSWEGKAENIQIGTSNTAYIAPSLLFASAWSVKIGNVSFDDAKKRCATYQEAGYPAGRWRLPTEAEINFVQTLQAKEMIPILFREGSYYWASSGYVYNGTKYTKPNNAIDSGVRCVYDVWYWGEKAESVSTYHPEP